MGLPVVLSFHAQNDRISELERAGSIAVAIVSCVVCRTSSFRFQSSAKAASGKSFRASRSMTFQKLS